MNSAPSVGRVVGEESWFILDPFVTSFLRVTDGIGASGRASLRTAPWRDTVLFHPDSNRRLGNPTQIC
jgi:hypothetical protein